MLAAGVTPAAANAGKDAEAKMPALSCVKLWTMKERRLLIMRLSLAIVLGALLLPVSLLLGVSLGKALAVSAIVAVVFIVAGEAMMRLQRLR